MTDDNSPRLIGRKEAAAYCGIGESTFSLWVSTHKMPPAVPGTRKWDKRAIDARLDEISGIQPKNDEEAREKQDLNHALRWSVPRHSSNYQDWKAKKIKRREKYRPKLGLDAKLERIVTFMASHPDCVTMDVIPGAGPTLLNQLAEKGAVIAIAPDRSGATKFRLTEEGLAEVVRLKKWKSMAP